MFGYKKILAAMTASVLMATGSYGFDDKREGFIFSLGAGYNITTTDFNTAYDGWDTGRSEIELGLATSFKIGYGINEQVTAYLFRNSSFIHGYDSDPNSDVYGNCITGLGVNYYLDNSKFYILGGVGQGQLSKLSDAESDASKGFGIMGGFGYILAEHIQAEINYMAIRVDDDIKLASDSLHVTINYYFY